MRRRDWLRSAIGIPACLAAAAEEHSFVMLAEEEAARARKNLGPLEAPVRANLEAALQAGPWTVTAHRPPHVAAGPNDYYSEGPYWWPDPKNPGGPYIRRDGYRNPDRFMGNRRDLGEMCPAVLALGMGAYFLRSEPAAAHASRVLSTWFTDPKTRMNPNLEYGQAVRGHNTGRGIGIIDTAAMIHVVQGIQFLKAAGRLDAGLEAGLHRWFADYLRWMTASRKGLDEKQAGNNHGTYWTAQAAAYAHLTADREVRKMAWNHYRTYLVPHQIRPDGSCPLEEARTQSLSYSAGNLDGFAMICRMAERDGLDLWHFRTPQGIGVELSFRYLLPFLMHPDRWRKEQISRFEPGGYAFPALAGLGLKSAEMLRAYEGFFHGNSPWNVLTRIIVRAASIRS